MKTSWNDTQLIESYLQEDRPDEKLVLEARLILQNGLAENVAWQKQAYVLVNNYSRKKLREEIEAVHQLLFTAREHSGFCRKIAALFLKK